MSKKKASLCITESRLPWHTYHRDLIEFCDTYADQSYMPGEKLSVKDMKLPKNFECTDVEILKVEVESSDDEDDTDEDFDFDLKLRIRVKVPSADVQSIKEFMKSWISSEKHPMKYQSHEVTNTTETFVLIDVICLAEGYSLDYIFGDVLESPLLKDVWDGYMDDIISEGVCYIHGAVDVTLRDTLRKNINYLADNIVVDYHPNSNDVVRDLVHPALYPYVKGVSKMKSNFQHPNAENEIRKEDYWGRKYEDSKFQWLPTPFVISSDGNCTITEYINNLNKEKFPLLYDDLEKLFDVFLPYFEEVWSYIESTTLFRGERHHNFNNRITEEISDEDKKIVSLKGRELQVIVKIVEYTLQPGQSYEGVWHAEGMSHENIVMTGIYFLDRDIDITGGDLRFKRSFTVAERNQVFSSVPQCRPRTINQLAWEGYVPLGSFPTEEGYLLVFPNCHIHKISKMVNTAMTKSSSRRIVVFFMINPDQPIISTREVAPQQDKIDLQQAKTFRLELMSERKYNKNKLNVRDIELCEH